MARCACRRADFGLICRPGRRTGRPHPHKQFPAAPPSAWFCPDAPHGTGRFPAVMEAIDAARDPRLATLAVRNRGAFDEDGKSWTVAGRRADPNGM